VPGGEKIPSAGDCYRFNLTNPAVDLCLTGPRSASDLAAALEALDKGPMTPAEMDWMRRVGQAKYFKPTPVLHQGLRERNWFPRCYDLIT